MVPNNEKKGDYYVNLYLFELKDELWFSKMVGSKVFFMKLKHQFIYPNEVKDFMVPNYEKSRDYYVNPCLSQMTDEL